MKINISKERLMSQMDSKTKREFVNQENRPDKGTPTDILNFRHYFDGFELLEGQHGPEQDGDKIYLSVYHFLEYQGKDPHDYDTEGIGGYLSRLTLDRKWCLYREFKEKINKYDYKFLVNHESEFITK